MARDVLDRLERRFRPQHARSRARLLHLSVREGSGIDPHFLEHGLEEESPATIFFGARFQVTERPLVLVCAKCGEPLSGDSMDEKCPGCGKNEVRPEGDEIQFEGVIWEES